MKKKYSAPVIEIESFQLDAAIAASCGAKLNHSANTCTYGESGYFTGACAIDIESTGGIYDGICYHGPLDGDGGLQFLSS